MIAFTSSSTVISPLGDNDFVRFEFHCLTFSSVWSLMPWRERVGWLVCNWLLPGFVDVSIKHGFLSERPLWTYKSPKKTHIIKFTLISPRYVMMDPTVSTVTFAVTGDRVETHIEDSLYTKYLTNS